MILAGRLAVPDATVAILCDMDGVLIDTLSMDYAVIHEVLGDCGLTAELPNGFIRDNYAYDLPEFWRRTLVRIGVPAQEHLIAALTKGYEERRLTWPLTIHEGVNEILAAAKAAGLGTVAVSNNPESQVRMVLHQVGLLEHFDSVVGNDQPGLRKKPAPDPYIEAARRVGAAPEQCVAIEDSLLGSEAAAQAGCHTVAVATGANDFADLEDSGFVDRAYSGFTGYRVKLGRDGVTQKTLSTPNDFVSHMVEHIAWRLGCSIELRWSDDDWRALGDELGRAVAELGFRRTSAAALGMIDDGSAEIAIRREAAGGQVGWHASGQVDLDWFLGLRCEQLRSGGPLVEMLRGIAEGAGLDVEVTVAGVEDPHHTWEAVFRGVGIALSHLCAAPAAASSSSLPPAPSAAARVAGAGAQETSGRPVEQGWHTDWADERGSCVRRETAESLVSIEVSMGVPEVKCSIDVADSIRVDGMAELLEEFARGAGLSMTVQFSATRLNSSHVVTEDIGMVLGRAIKSMAVERTSSLGIQGAGSNVSSVDDLSRLPIRTGISLEGRKFWKYVPFVQDYSELRKSFLIGHTLPSGLFSEDLDDFIDGLSGGMSASVIVHFGRPVSPVEGWPAIFGALGESVAELLSVNPERKDLPPGVKATLA